MISSRHREDQDDDVLLKCYLVHASRNANYLYGGPASTFANTTILSFANVTGFYVKYFG